MNKNATKNNYFFFLYLVLLASISAYAGTTDSLGLQTTWTTVSGWFDDGYMMKIIAFLMMVFAITLAVMKQYLYAILVLIMTVIVSNLSDVIDKFASATF